MGDFYYLPPLNNSFIKIESTKTNPSIRSKKQCCVCNKGWKHFVAGRINFSTQVYCIIKRFIPGIP